MPLTRYCKLLIPLLTAFARQREGIRSHKSVKRLLLLNKKGLKPYFILLFQIVVREKVKGLRGIVKPS
ncbi:MAG: hypothetical protein BGO76_07260 [Caedibacter sp. 38-128]|nr:MAG: hypothetical protein BGO76_07260 [Caedibacter sp. 38-128]